MKNNYQLSIVNCQLESTSLHTYNIAAPVTAFSTTRAGGVSTGSYAAFNANHYCGDDPAHVTANRKALCQLLGIEEGRLIVPHQTHCTRVQPITSEFLQLSADERQQALEGIDAVCTHLSKVCVCVSTADCIPVLLYDAIHHAVAAIHAGWRGTCARIVLETIQKMQQIYGTLGKDLQTVIGPGISLESFEVGDEVYDAFQQAGFRMDTIAKRYPANGGGEKWHIDLWECNRQQLLAAGVSTDNIQVAGICTYQNHEQFFSARRLGIKSGRILTGITLND